MKRRNKQRGLLVDDAHWYKDAIIYELHVRAFCDSNGDGIGDFQGLISKLDYLHDLGVTAIWLLPFYPSPLRDDGYDIADYTSINPSYGDIGDFKQFVREAHDRGLRVITELVINHTSTEHPWFQRARKAAPGSKYRDFYVWSDTPERYSETRIIFKDFETSNWSWDPVAKAYYWHRFYAHQPDLNFDNPQVKKAIFKVLDFWMEMGVDGMRLDAVPYLFEREGTNCENLPETHDLLRELRAHVDRRHENRMLLAEANQWPVDAVAYFGNGDECHMNFHFPLMPRMFMALHRENNFPIVDILEQTPPLPEGCQWAVFLRNHDELTLEMVTDEDRDYMNRMYAEDPKMRINLGIRRRLAPLMRSRRKLELMNLLLFSLPGTPVVYYGDEIGMGDNVYLGDRNGVRTPMQWSGDRNAGFSRGNPQRLFLPVIIDPEYHYEACNAEAHQSNPSSLLWWMKRVMALRKQYPVFGRGETRFIPTENTKVLAFVRCHQESQVLVVANLSRFAQHAHLDLADYAGMTPLEMFGKSMFPAIEAHPYGLSLLPHGCFWFELVRPAAEETDAGAFEVRDLPAQTLDDLFEEHMRALEQAIGVYAGRQRWFRSKTRKQKALKVVDRIALPLSELDAVISVLDVAFVDGTSETYVLPLAILAGDAARVVTEQYPQALLARVQVEGGVLVDALAVPEVTNALLGLFGRKKVLRGSRGKVQIATYKTLGSLRDARDNELTPRVMGVEQSNTSVVYGDRLILKVYRKLEEGVNPDLEVSRFLTVERSFAHVPPVAGALEYLGNDRPSATLAVLQGFVPNQGDVWKLTLEELERTYDVVLSRDQHAEPVDLEGSLLGIVATGLPKEASDAIGAFGPLVELLGQRTAQLHLALASGQEEAFVPEPVTSHYQHSLYQSARSRLAKTMQLLQAQLSRLPTASRSSAQALLDRRKEIDVQVKGISSQKISVMRIRCHGDYHLGQVLYTGKDFAILDFEGEPGRAMSERRFKTPAIRDVAGMVRSFHYAAAWSLEHGQRVSREEEGEELMPWAEVWSRAVSAVFVRAYLTTAAGAPVIPGTWEELSALLGYYLLDKCMYELEYELNNRPQWATIPLRGIAALLEEGQAQRPQGNLNL